MLTNRPTQLKEIDLMPKNFPALQERMDTVKRTHAEKTKLTARSPLEIPVNVEKDDTFFLL